MESAENCPPRSGIKRPHHEIAEIFRAHGETYRREHVLSPEQREVMWCIEACRTAVLGGHVDVCDRCDHSAPSYNSCRNRHCPKCQSLAQAEWIEKRKTRILPTHYFHVVFTVPHELGRLARRNPKRMYDLLFESASRTLLEFGRSRLGAQIGATVVLHTWTRELNYHPHVHCIVTGGGLALTKDRWVSAKRGYLFPVRALSKVFRGKFLDGLKRTHEKAELDLGGDCADLGDSDAFKRLMQKLRRKDWVVYAKQPFGGPEQVFQYLGRYTHRVGISNHRLQSIEANQVRFATKAGGSVTLSTDEFIRRFLLHVLPGKFVKIRHYGLMASSNATTKLALARRVMEADGAHTSNLADGHAATTVKDWRERFKELTGIDLSICPRCRQGSMNRYPLAEMVLPADIGLDSS